MNPMAEKPKRYTDMTEAERIEKADQIAVREALEEGIRPDTESTHILGKITEKQLTRDPIDQLLETIDSHIAHHEKQPQTHYVRGYIKGLNWTKTEIRKTFGR